MAAIEEPLADTAVADEPAADAAATVSDAGDITKGQEQTSATDPENEAGKSSNIKDESDSKEEEKERPSSTETKEKTEPTGNSDRMDEANKTEDVTDGTQEKSGSSTDLPADYGSKVESAEPNERDPSAPGSQTVADPEAVVDLDTTADPDTTEDLDKTADPDTVTTSPTLESTPENNSSKSDGAKEGDGHADATAIDEPAKSETVVDESTKMDKTKEENTKPDTTEISQVESEPTLDETDGKPDSQKEADDSHTDKPDEESIPVVDTETSQSPSESKGLEPTNDGEDLQSANEGGGEVSTSSTNNLETINQKRQEEKEIFQKLIDDVTRLENELSAKTTAYTELQMNLDVRTIELETHKEKSEDTEKRITELEKELADAEAKLSAARRIHDNDDGGSERSAEIPVSDQEKQKYDEEMKELHQKVKRLTQDDELKTERLSHLEGEISDYMLLMSRLEDEIGKEKLESLRHGKNGVGQHGNSSGERPKPVQGNAVSPDTQQSKACVIL